MAFASRRTFALACLGALIAHALAGACVARASAGALQHARACGVRRALPFIDAPDGQVLDAFPERACPASAAQRDAPHCTPLIGARTGRPLLWALFLLLLVLVAGRTKRQLHAHGSTRQRERDSGAAPPPHL